jgi:hypothetical protein
VAITRLAWVSSALIRSLTSRALTGSSSLTITSTLGVDVVDQIRWQDQRRQHVSGAHLFHRCGVILHVYALDPFADPVADADPGQFGAADRDPRLSRHFIEEGDARLLRRARDREAD